MAVLVTGAAGFIGYHVCAALLGRGESVIGVDNFNDYYDVSLKEARLAELTGQANFTSLRIDIADRGAPAEAGAGIDRVVPPAAQAALRRPRRPPAAFAPPNTHGPSTPVRRQRGSGVARTE